MKDLYLKSGYVNAEKYFQDPAPFIMAIGGRGIGKTYGVLEQLLKRKEKFIYMRRTQSMIDTLKFPNFNPFRSVDDSICTNSIGKYTIGFYHGVFDEKDNVFKPAGEPIGVGVALSTFGSIRGIDGNDFTCIMYDEFIPQTNDRKIKNEGTSFLNAIESINRNRELNGRQPLKTILLSNSNSIDSPIIESLGALRVISGMMKKGVDYKQINDLLSIYLYFNSPISEAKRQTALYKLSNNDDFNSMSLDNRFSQNDFEWIKNKPLNEYRPIVSIGEITICEHKSGTDIYIISGSKAPIRYTTLKNDLKAFQTKYFKYYQKLVKREIAYADIVCKLEFEKIWGV